MTRPPIRTCVACRRRRPQHELVRIVRSSAGVALDLEQRRAGRGAYVCPDPGCVAAARRRGGQAVRKTLRGAGEREVMNALAAVPTAGEPADTTNSDRARRR